MDMDSKIPGFVWTCKSCIHAIPTIKNLSKVLIGVKDEQSSCRSDIKTLKDKMDTLENSIDGKVQSAVEEYRDREARKCNLIVHQVPESSLPDAKERNAEDTAVVSQILVDIGVQDAKLESVVRLGKRIPDKHRLMKVTVDSVSSKIQALRNAKRLRNTQHWKEVFVTPDMTPKEREKNKALREELKRRRDDGEEHLVIRNGEIAKVEDKPSYGSYKSILIGDQVGGSPADCEAVDSSSDSEEEGTAAAAAGDPFRD